MGVLHPAPRLGGMGADEAKPVAWDGSAWALVVEGSLNPTPLIGVNATADAANRLAVSSPATLLDHEGAGHQLKINKNAATDTASLLLQTGFSGRAELGSCGDDDLHIKVSADGTIWREALVIDKDTAEIVAAASGAAAVPLSLMEAASQTAALLRLAGSTGLPLFERPASKSLNDRRFGMIINQNPYTDGSGVGGENYNNEVIGLGWNLGNVIGTAAVDNEAAIWDTWEYKYNSGGKYVCERHMTLLDTSGVDHRFFSVAASHDGTECSMGFTADGLRFYDYAGNAKIVWNIEGNAAFIGDGTTQFPLYWNKYGSAILGQLNAAGNAYLALPYFGNISSPDQLIYGSYRVLFNGPDMTSGSGPAYLYAFQAGFIPNGASAFAVNCNTQTNSEFYAFYADGNTNYRIKFEIRNHHATGYAQGVVSGDGPAFFRASNYLYTINWSWGKDGSGNFFLGEGDPGSNTVLTADKTNLNVAFAKPPKLPSHTVAGVPSAATYGAGSMIFVSDELGGAVPAYSDGTDWRRVTDGAVVS